MSRSRPVLSSVAISNKTSFVCNESVNRLFSFPKDVSNNYCPEFPSHRVLCPLARTITFFTSGGRNPTRFSRDTQPHILCTVLLYGLHVLRQEAVYRLAIAECCRPSRLLRVHGILSTASTVGLIQLSPYHGQQKQTYRVVGYAKAHLPFMPQILDLLSMLLGHGNIGHKLLLYIVVSWNNLCLLV